MVYYTKILYIKLIYFQTQEGKSTIRLKFINIQNNKRQQARGPLVTLEHGLCLQMINGTVSLNIIYYRLAMGGCSTGTVDQYDPQARIRHNSLLLEEDLACYEATNLRRPSLVQQGIRIRKNSNTGMLEGMPKQWCQKFNFPFKIDESKTVNTHHLPQQIKPQHDLPKQIMDFIAKRKQNSQIFLKKKQRDQQQCRKEAAEFFGFQNNSKASTNDFSTISILSESIDTNTVIDIITNYGNEIEESKFERQLLSTSEFKHRLETIQIIEDKPTRYFKFLNQLGSGSICKVYKACSISYPNRLYAVRIMTVPELQDLQKIKEQIVVMTMCQSRNIIEYHFSYYYQSTLFMFIQHMEFGALSHFVNHFRKDINQRVIAYIIRQILKGLDAIHSRRQLHRDLKSDNILINKFGDLKIGDFGYALQFTKEKTTCSDHAGTPAWMAPELIKKEEYTQSVDIWSLGIILVQLCEGQPRYLSMKPLIAMVLIASRPPENVTGRSIELRNFLSRCLKKQGGDRATAKELLLDPFIVSIGNGITQKQQFVKMLACIKR